MDRADFSPRGKHLLRRLLPLFLLSIIAAGTGPGCRDKDNPYIPSEPSDTLPWRLVLRAPEIMYIDDAVGHVNNDTITVRLYDQFGRLHAGTSIYSVALSGPGQVAPQVVSSTDTVNHWWGTGESPLIYYGNGSESGQEYHDTISSWVIVDDDTVARASVSFIIRPDTSATGN